MDSMKLVIAGTRRNLADADPRSTKLIPRLMIDPVVVILGASFPASLLSDGAGMMIPGLMS